MKWSLPLCSVLALGARAAAIPSETDDLVIVEAANHNATIAETDGSTLDSRATNILYYGVSRSINASEIDHHR